jgi:hypothetical protein
MNKIEKKRYFQRVYEDDSAHFELSDIAPGGGGWSIKPFPSVFKTLL